MSNLINDEVNNSGLTPDSVLVDETTITDGVIEDTLVINNLFTGLIAFGAGVIFALGLIISQMVNPNKVLAFLRIVKNWDPSLGLVMGGAIAVAMPAFWVAKRRYNNNDTAFNGAPIELPTTTAITWQLMVGSVLFGIGWGLVGFCPAPALVTAMTGNVDALLFFVAMLGGFGLHAVITRSQS